MLKYGLFFLVFFPVFVYGQAIDNLMAYKHLSKNKQVRFNYENDYFSATDRYYTQGINLETVNPFIEKLPFKFLNIQPKNYVFRFGIGAEHNAYTPSSIRFTSFPDGERPYCASLFFKSFAIGINEENKSRFSTSYILGVTGPSAGGMEMQVGIHTWLDNLLPFGWENQIHDHISLNYQINFEKNLYQYKNNFLVNYDAILHVGTLSDKLSGGITLMAGIFDSPFITAESEMKNKIYIYNRMGVNAVAYNATLQGGMFNKTSPFVISSQDVSRIVLQDRIGAAITLNKLTLEYFRHFLSKEFNTGMPHSWGGIQIAFAW